MILSSVWIFCTKYGQYDMLFDQLNYNIFHLNFVFLGQNFIGHSVWWYLIFSCTGTDFASQALRSYSVWEILLVPGQAEQKIPSTQNCLTLTYGFKTIHAE